MDSSGTEASFGADLADVRERIVQIKRETDAKASAEHEHDELIAGIDRVERDLETTRGELEAVRETTEGVEGRIDEGFENYRELLERLLDRTETIESRLDTLGTTVFSVREGEEARKRLADLARTANRAGVRTAACDACEASVDIGLLTDPACPHCETAFSELVAGNGLFGTATLEGRR